MDSSGSLVPSRLNTTNAGLSAEDESTAITASMDHLSIDPPSSLRNRSPSPMARVNSQTLQGSPSSSSRPSTRNGPSNTGWNKYPESPRSARKTSSPLVSRRDSNGAPASPALRRKSSSTFSLRSPSQTRAPPSPSFERPPVTAASVAAGHFKKELLQHDSFEPNGPDTVVVLHDSCYGHRFSRSKVPKSTLNLIVERPERLQASAWGVSGAYVKLGERHSDGSHPIHPKREPESQFPFRILKSNRATPITAPVVSNVHGIKWTQELKQMADAAEARLLAGSKELARPDTPNANANKPHLHEGDLYLCKESLNAFQGAIGGVLDAVDTVFGATSSGKDTTKAFVCIRPPGHHCSSDHPSGFCWLNNVHIGIEHAALAHGLTHAAIVDFDLHHGDGSQSITWDRNAKAAKAAKNASLSKKTFIGYYSLHDINSYPCEWGDVEKVQNASLCIENAHSQSIWNVHLQPWKTEEDFWALYESRYLVLLEKARVFLQHHTQRLKKLPGALRPKAAIFVSAGFDASEHEGEGMQRHQVTVPTSFYSRFTSDIVRLANEEGTGVDGRVISVLEGGYSDRALTSGVLSHLVGLTQTTKSNLNPTLDTRWWSLPALMEFEALLRPNQPLPIQVKKRPSEQGNYASPTQSFAAKVVDAEKMYRSISGTMKPAVVSRPPSPPPPDVDWCTAAHELGKLLIPSDRPIFSCRHDELNEPKPRTKKERHSAIGLPTTEQTSERVTRGRKAKADVGNFEGKINSEVRNPGRRRTISDLPAPPELSDAERAEVDVDVSTRPSTSAGSPTKDVFSGDASSATSRRSSTSRKSPPPFKPAVPVPLRSRRSSGGGIAVTKRPAASRQPSQMSIKEESSISAHEAPATRQLDMGDAPLSAPSAASVEQLASRVKRITLHPPKGPVESSAANVTADKPAKPARRAPGPKASKTTATASKGPSGRATKQSKVVPTVPNADDRPAKLNDTVSLVNATGMVTQNTAMQQPEVNESNESTMPPPAQKTLATSHTDTVTASVPSTDANGTPEGKDTKNQEQLGSAAFSRSSPTDTSSYDPHFIPYQPPQPLDHPASIKPESLTWMDPHTVSQGTPPPATPAAARTRGLATGKENLYVANALGPIPFSPSKTAAEDASALSARTVLSSSESSVAPVSSSTAAKDSSTIWDVPITPGPQ